MKLSIITVNFNNHIGLQQTIESVITQIFTDFEWIVVDGGSTDGSKDLIEQYSNHFSYWISEPDKGIYNAMNKGIVQAHGDYLLFLNSGDWLNGSYALSELFDSNISGDIIYCDVINVIEGENHYHSFPDTITLSYFLNFFINHQSTLIKRDLFANELYDDTLRIYGDWAMFIKWMLQGKKFVHHSKYLSYYNFEGISSNVSELHIREKESIIRSVIPNAILLDLQQLLKLQEEHNQLESNNRIINSHKSLHFLNTIYTKLIHMCQQTISTLENKLGK